MYLRFIALLLFLGNCCHAQKFETFVADFITGYKQLNVPGLEYDYRDYFNSIPSPEKLELQQKFFQSKKLELSTYKRTGLKRSDRILYDHLLYILDEHLVQVSLQQGYKAVTSSLPPGGISLLENGKEWYRFFIHRFTTTNITPEEVFALGQSEVKRVKSEISAIQGHLGFADSAAFYAQLNSERFFITDKQQLIQGFQAIDSVVRIHLKRFIGSDDIPPVYAMEWPAATAFTPPGIYLNRADNAYGKDVFQFNFHDRRYNRRAMEWLYMHEAIPGHHLQFSLYGAGSELEELFIYPGNFEGWACYVEYFGKELGLYKDPYTYLGKWEWDLVRSARLVLDAGIHYYGWTREEALRYWKETIPNQDDIAEREVTRVTNWPGQALSYKVGAMQIFKMREAWLQKHPGRPASEFYRTFLSMGRLPLTVIEKNILA
jgi:uncharacterized protein (DUF885 family)